jgi:hypothetical protein
MIKLINNKIELVEINRIQSKMIDSTENKWIHLTKLNICFQLSKVHAKQVSIMTQWRRVKNSLSILSCKKLKEYALIFQRIFSY